MTEEEKKRKAETKEDIPMFYNELEIFYKDQELKEL